MIKTRLNHSVTHLHFSQLLVAGVMTLLTLLLTACESDGGGVTARAQEKSATYAALKPWQKKYVDKGSVAEGFTPDMVYISMGKPDKVDTKQLAEGKAEMWIYSRYYPNVDAIHGYRSAEFSTESAYQPQRGTTERTGEGSTVPLGMSRGGGASISNTGGPQGGSMEPADLRSYTVKVLFANDKVVRIGADVNP